MNKRRFRKTAYMVTGRIITDVLREEKKETGSFGMSPEILARKVMVKAGKENKRITTRLDVTLKEMVENPIETAALFGIFLSKDQPGGENHGIRSYQFREKTLTREEILPVFKELDSLFIRAAEGTEALRLSIDAAREKIEILRKAIEEAPAIQAGLFDDRK